MFWGLILEPSKLYSQIVEKPFHISQAALDLSTGDSEFCQVMVSVDRKKFLICTLQKPGTIQAALDLYFKAGESITFVTNGNSNIHLTGYLDPEFEDEEEVEEEEEEEDNEVSVTPVIKRKAASDNYVTAKKVKKNTKVAEESDSESDEGQLTKFLDGRDLDTDEDDETFIANTSTEADDSDEDSDEEEEAEEEEDEDEDSEDGEKEINDSVDFSKLTKSQKRRLKKKLSKQSEAKPKVNGVSIIATNKTKETKKAEKKEEKKNEKKEPQKEKKALTGGVQIEDLKAGNGPLAKAGKVVSVYYEGRLKQNNKTFDKCNKGPGFKFKLGAKEVISGWDIGVAGMKVGGVRKIVCPPPMAYGAKGSPPVIPPNSTLVFEVELKSVK